MRNAVNKILKSRLRLVVVLVSLYVLSLAVMVMAFRPRGWIAAVYVLAPVLVYEIVLRLALRLVFGRHYRYGLFNYFIVDHPVYGFGFRKNAQAKTVPFPVFDQFVFRPGSGQILDLEDNKRARVSFNINSLGFRGAEFPVKKRDPRVIRIFASGGSTTACVSVSEEDTWPARLEQELQSRGYNVEVINAGVGAWYSYQERLRFEREIINYQPDIVLLHQGWNEEFTYSMQNLGRAWRPGLLLNAVELKSMYSRVGRLFSSTSSIFFHFLVTSYFQDFRFKTTMRSANPARWQCLRSRSYLEHWFDNLMAIARQASRNGIKLYTINAPGLCDFADLEEDRQLYVKGAGIKEAFADYVAVSKKRIQKTLLETSFVIACLDIEQEIKPIRGQDRLKLFIDEFHLGPDGNALLAKKICEQLVARPDFGEPGSNVAYDDKLVEQLRAAIGSNYSYLDEFLDRTIERLKNSAVKDGVSLEMPMQRYTTF